MNNLGINIDKYFETLETKQVNCEHHGNYEQRRVKVNLTGKEIMTRCPTCEAINRERKAQEGVKKYISEGKKEYHRNIVNKLFERSQIPPKFTGKSFNNFFVTSENATNLAKIRDYAHKIDDNLANAKGLILFGSKGTGKSHLSCAIAECAIQKHYSALFITADEIIEDVKSAYSENTSAKAKMKLYTTPDLLIVDEITLGVAEKDMKILANILNARYSSIKSTIVITNLGLNGAGSLESVIGGRILDRFRENNIALQFTGNSFRSKQ